MDADAPNPGTGTALDPYSSIQYAIDQTSTVDGDVLLINAGTYAEAVELTKSLVLRAHRGSSMTILDATSSAGATLSIGAGATVRIEGLSLVGGTGFAEGSERSGGGLFIHGGATAELVKCVVRDNRGTAGAGIAVRDGLLRMVRCQVVENIAELASGFNIPGAGGGVRVDAEGVLEAIDCTVSRNWGWVSGCGIYSVGTILLDRCDISDNIGVGGNHATQGNGILSWGTALISDSSIVGNSGTNGSRSRGGGFYGLGRLEHCVIAGNANWHGGGAAGPVSDPASLVLIDCLLQGNRGLEGGGVASATLLDCVLSENDSYGTLYSYGAGAAHSSLVNCQVLDNEAIVSMGVPGRGGGTYDCEVVGGRITGNVANDGGGCYFSTLTDVVIADNSAAFGGGAAMAELVRCSLVGNVAGVGAGAHVSDLDHCALVGNVASAGGAALDGGSATNSILWNNSPDQASDSAAVSWSTVEGGFSGIGNISEDPMFWMPQTQDLHLKSASPCIDAGDPAGLPDPDGTRTDQGPFPVDAAYCTTAANFCVASPDFAGCAPAIGATGTPTISGADDLVLFASPVANNKVGLLAWSLSANPHPVLGGILCLGGQIRRLRLVTSGGEDDGAECSGRFEVLFPQMAMSAAGLQPQTTVYAQFVYRDGTDGLAFSDALEFTLCP